MPQGDGGMQNHFSLLSDAGKRCARELYSASAPFFPLIAAVLDGAQKGVAFGNDAECPTEIYVEHSFGFSQLFGQPQEEFEKAFEQYLLEERAFAAPKVRLYTPLVPYFFQNGAYSQLRSERQRFHPGGKTSPPLPTGNSASDIRGITAELMPQVAKAFPLTGYFWPDAEAFLAHSMAQVVYADDEPAAICYAAAVADGKAEVDIFTVPEFRGRGYATQAGSAFIEYCAARDIEPLWDCFTNNAGSMRLAGRLGFVPSGAPYQFFTIPR